MVKASSKTVVGEVSAPVELKGSTLQVVDTKGIQISFDTRQIPQIKFSGKGTEWSIRDILHVKRLLTREYKRYLRGFIRQDVKIKEEKEI